MHAFNYRTEDWVAAAKHATGGRGVDMILDMVGGDYIARNLDLLVVEGRLVQIAFLKSAKAELDFSVMMRKRAVDHRIDAAAAHAGGEGRHRARAARARLAAAREGHRRAGDSPDLSARGRGRRAPADGGRHAHWKARPRRQ